MSRTIYPSLLSIERSTLAHVIKTFDPHCSGYHIDIMDGAFVPTTTEGVSLVNFIAETSMRPQQWVHLMVDYPQLFVKTLLMAGGSYFTFHFESKCESSDMITSIREKNWRPSIAIKPKTAVEKIFPLANALDQILIMSVEPGYAGQQFLKESVQKVQKLAAYRATAHLPFRIAIDGGVDATNIQMLAQAGVDDFAVSSAIFAKNDPIKALQELQNLIKVIPARYALSLELCLQWKS